MAVHVSLSHILTTNINDHNVPIAGRSPDNGKASRNGKTSS
jgi:hypothetical protein